MDDEGKKTLKARYSEPGLRYGDLKQELFERVMDYFAPFREKRSRLISKPDFVYDVLKEGAKKARLIGKRMTPTSGRKKMFFKFLWKTSKSCPNPSTFPSMARAVKIMPISPTCSTLTSATKINRTPMKKENNMIGFGLIQIRPPNASKTF